MITVPIRNRRAERGMFVQKLQHAVPSIVVLGDGLDHLSHNPHGTELALGVFEVVAAVLVMVSVIRGFRKLVKGNTVGAEVHAHHGIDWIDIFIGLMVSVEAYAKYHASPTHQIPRPTIVIAVTMLVAGLMHGRIVAWGDRRRQLRVSEEGISMPGRPFPSRMSLAWSEVASIDIDERYASVIAADGRKQRFDLTGLHHAGAVRDALMQARTLLDAARHAASASIESNAPPA